VKARLSAKPAQSVSRAPEIGQRLSPIEASEQPQNAPLSNLPGRPDLSFSLSRIPILGPGNSSEHHERLLQPSSPVTSPLQRSPLRRHTSERATQPAERPSRSLVQQLATRAIDTPAETLPYANRIQRSFGHHNIDTVRVHRGPIATANARSVQARAFATGNHIVFADTPDLHTAAHEAAHVIQQSAGVQLADGMDIEGDRYEQHAEAVARQVIGGYSAESLLDHIPGTTQPHARANGQVQADTGNGGKSANGVLAPLATGVSIQRVKMKQLGSKEPEPLTLDEQSRQKQAFQAVKGEKTAALQKPLDEAELQRIRLALLEDAQNVLQGFNATRVKNPIEVRPGNQDVLNRAIEDVLAAYGPYVKEAASSFLAEEKSIQYKNVESRWEKLKQSEGEVVNEFPTALQYMFDNAADFKSIKEVLETITKAHDDNRVGVEEAFTEYVVQNPDKELTNTLVELRVRWSPYTLGDTIHAEQEQDKESTLKSASRTPWLNTLRLAAWGNYKQMIHEVVHTAAHPKFKAYLELLPPYLHNIIDEGTTDYFALQIWEKVLKPFNAFFEKLNAVKLSGKGNTPKPSKEQDKLVKIVHSVQKAISHLPANSQNLLDLSENKKYALYQEQEAAIKQSLTSLKDGERRLKAAYFYGEVDRFFPPVELFLNEEDEEGEGEEGENSMQEEDNEKNDSERKRKAREEEINVGKKPKANNPNSLKEEDSEGD
jgi:hypothetical protein